MTSLEMSQINIIERFGNDYRYFTSHCENSFFDVLFSYKTQEGIYFAFVKDNCKKACAMNYSISLLYSYKLLQRFYEAYVQ